MENVLRVEVAKTLLGETLYDIIEEVANTKLDRYWDVNNTDLYDEIYTIDQENVEGIIDNINKAVRLINKEIGGKNYSEKQMLEIAKKYIDQYYDFPTLDIAIDDNGMLVADRHNSGFSNLSEYYFIVDSIDDVSYETLDGLNDILNQHIKAYSKYLNDIDRYVEGNYQHAYDCFIERMNENDDEYVTDRFYRGLGRMLYDEVSDNVEMMNRLRDFLNVNVVDETVLMDNFKRLVELLELR
jgi:tRNA uridine 5-carbamoylmethylation protein Kti12